MTDTAMPATAKGRAAAFCERFGLRVPILLAPMAGSTPAPLAAAVANAGGMGALGALNTTPEGIADWARAFRAGSNGSFQINLWIPDPPPIRDAARATRMFLILWLAISIGNLLVGVLYAGYGWTEEAGIWLLVFGAPAAVALAARRIVP